VISPGEFSGRLGRWATVWLREKIAIGSLPYGAVKGAVLERGRGSRLVVRAVASQIYYTAIEPLGVFLLIALTIGSFAVVLSDALMRPNGLAPHVPSVIAHSLVRELLPIVIAVVLTGRTGTAIATELGYMRVSNEIEALEAVGVNIDYFVVLPRLLGVMLSSLGLTVVLSAAALVGGFLVGDTLGLVPAGLRLQQIAQAVTPLTVAFALGKASLFGLLIASINCFHGLAVGRVFTDIPRANVRGALQCYLACFLLNAALSLYALLLTA
jgi:phospholipid/cholesterol/gamma-HCH transport system permease protein